MPESRAIVQDLWDLNRSYESAVHALDYRFFFPHQNVFDGREALGHDLSATDFSDSRGGINPPSV